MAVIFTAYHWVLVAKTDQTDCVHFTILLKARSLKCRNTGLHFTRSCQYTHKRGENTYENENKNS